MQIKIKKLFSTAKIPIRADEGSVGYDLYAHIPEGHIHIFPNETCLIDTGIATEIPNGYWGGIYARSGLACKHGLRPANCTGVIDSSYRDSIKVALHNDNERKYGKIRHGDRIAQLIIHKCENTEFVEAEALSETERGIGGFGSSGR